MELRYILHSWPACLGLSSEYCHPGGARFPKPCVSLEMLIGPLGLMAGAEADTERQPELAVLTRAKSRLNEPVYRIRPDCPVGSWELQRLS